MSDINPNSNTERRADTTVSDEELRKRRIRREIVRVQPEEEFEDEDMDDDDVEEIDEDEVDDEAENDVDEEKAEDDEAEDDGQAQDSKSKSLWKHIVTGGFITSDGAVQYYRYLVAIAIMCFISIFLTFMSLNANGEYRRKEKLRDELRERSIALREQRLRISQREEVKQLIHDKDSMIMVDQETSFRI